MKSKLVVILTKYPESGKVKTRLAKTVGFEKAAKIQEKLISELLKNNSFIDNDYDLKICLSPSEKKQDFSNKFKIKNENIFSVNIGDLGNTMKNIFLYGFKKYSQVILVGSDIPKLNEIHFNNGFNFLKENDIILGPTFDGGYYLIGMKNINNFLFEEIIYSTETVLDETISKCLVNNLSYKLLNIERDIDDYEDILELAKTDKIGFYKTLLNE